MEFLHTYTTRDRSYWGAGPWDSEPDKVQWIDEATDLDCIAVRNRTGAWCGYVGVGPEHPWHGLGYSDSDCGHSGCYKHTPEGRIRVHGGITYTNECAEGDEAESICHIPEPGRPDPVWWFGFDCCHGGDLYPAYRSVLESPSDTYRTLEYVREQCREMALQLREIEV